jgi:hypothetical protein
MGLNKDQEKRIIAVAGESIKSLMEICINEKIINPFVTMDAKTTDGEHYRLSFERLDLDVCRKITPKDISLNNISK